VIAFKDFVPKQLRKQGFIKPPVYETFQEAVTATGVWLREQEVTVINIETVVLPGLWSKDVPQSNVAKLTDISTSAYSSRELYQFVRVWYQAE